VDQSRPEAIANRHHARSSVPLAASPAARNAAPAGRGTGWSGAHRPGVVPAPSRPSSIAGASWLAVLPAALVLVFAFGCGTFASPLDARWVVAGHLLLGVFALFGCWAGRDPLALGGIRWLLAVGALVLILVAAVGSPVPRAGLEGLLLLPSFVFIVPAVAWLWRDHARRRLGILALAVVLLVVAIVALGVAAVRGGRAASPLGHHNLLALWLVMLMPVVAAPVSLPRRGRWLVRSAVFTALVALLVSRSLGGALGLAAALSVALVGGIPLRWRRLLVAGGLLLVAGSLPRAVSMVRGEDASLKARWGYVTAAARGLAAAPWRGWGPGAAAWTFAEHMRPQPGVHPAGQMISDPHSLPLKLAYELGLPAAGVLALLAVVLLARRPEEDPPFAQAAALGMVAFAVAGCFTRPLAATAVPVTLALLLGARRAGRARVKVDRLWARAAARAWLAASAVALVPLDAAHLAYDRAARAGDPAVARRALTRAVALDPWHPLYRARLAARTGSAPNALRAAEDARGVAALWLAAGQHTTSAQRAALARACTLDPLAPLAPFVLALADAQAPEATRLAARAMLAEPRLLAASAWAQQPALRAAAVAAVASNTGVDAGWREAFIAQADASQVASGRAQALALYADRDAATAMSLHGFGRRPWRWRLAAVAIDADALRAIDLVPAANLATTDPAVFAAGCD